MYMYIVVKTREFSENTLLNIDNVELRQSRLHLLLHRVTLCFKYSNDDYDLQIGKVTYKYIHIGKKGRKEVNI